jgi:esterase
MKLHANKGEHKMNNALHDSVIGEGPDVVLLHGLFGQGGNLGSIARALQHEFRVHTPDLPDHGHSQWTAEPSIAVYASAIAAWMAEWHLPYAHFVGHSLGGKVAMQLALSEPALVDKLVVADIAPVAYPPGHDGVFAGMAAVAAAGCRSRQEAAALLAKHIHEPSVVQFLQLSLRREANGTYQWRLNREGLEAGYAQLRVGLESDVPFDGDALFIRGGDSSYITEAAVPDIERLFSHVVIETIADTGHWLHAEKPAVFNALVLDFLV